MLSVLWMFTHHERLAQVATCTWTSILLCRFIPLSHFFLHLNALGYLALDMVKVAAGTLPDLCLVLGSDLDNIDRFPDNGRLLVVMDILLSDALGVS